MPEDHKPASYELQRIDELTKRGEELIRRVDELERKARQTSQSVIVVGCILGAAIGGLAVHFSFAIAELRG